MADAYQPDAVEASWNSVRVCFFCFRRWHRRRHLFIDLSFAHSLVLSLFFSGGKSQVCTNLTLILKPSHLW